MLRPPLTRAHHVGGTLLVILTLVSLSLVPYLPTRAAHETALPFLDGRDSTIVLAYAGFPGCGNTCPRGLASLAKVYDRHISTGGAPLDLLFINVQQNSPAPVAHAFAQAFHEKFDVYTIRGRDADDVYRKLALRSYDDVGGAAYHSDAVYVFTQHSGSWRIEKVYRRFPSIDRLAADLAQLTLTT